MNDYEDESMFNPCPNCGGELEVREGDFVHCKDCGEYIGWYIANAGAIRLMGKWDKSIDTGE